eukprot:1988769-Pleurochrysis_carterae.AAC.2
MQPLPHLAIDRLACAPDTLDACHLRRRWSPREGLRVVCARRMASGPVGHWCGGGKCGQGATEGVEGEGREGLGG